MLVAVALFAPCISIPLTSFDEPAIVVVPVPLEAAKPITLPVILWKLPLVPVVPESVIPAYRSAVVVNVRGAV